MMLLRKTFSPARAALLYLTIGALMEVWSGIWFLYMRNHPPTDEVRWYWCYGFLLTGLALVIIGLIIASVGRSARQGQPLDAAVATPVVAEKKGVAAVPESPVVAPLHGQMAATDPTEFG